MSESWAERQRRTNRLVRSLADYVFRRKTVTASQLYGLAKLTWITSSYEEDDAAYVRSTKLPALEDVFGKDYSRHSLGDVATDVAATLRSPAVEPLILEHSGFTHFYKAYRNAVKAWIDEHLEDVRALYRRAFALKTDEEGLSLVRSITKLPGIPIAGKDGRKMKPEYFLTPVLFALDARLRFPLINGNKGVQALLKKLNVSHASLEEQYTRLITLYQTGGIRDAADLDQVGHDLPDFLSNGSHKATKKLLEEKPTEDEHILPLKDENDIERLQQSLTIASRRIHNKLTNRLRALWSEWTLLEGSREDAMFDVLVKRYNDTDDLLIEAKSSIDPPQVRMALGQLFDYWFRLHGPTDPHVAVLLPEHPEATVLSMLEWLDVGALWFDGDRLETSTSWLEHLIAP